VEFPITYSADVAYLFALRELSLFLSAFLTVAERTKLTISTIFIIFVLFSAAIAASFLILFCLHVGIAQGENRVIVFIIEELVFGLRDFNDELVCLLFQLENEVVHHTYVYKAAEVVVHIVVVLQVVLGLGHVREWVEHTGVVLAPLIQGLRWAS
jgi:hypothetical protein